MICHYGCNQEAKYQLKNGEWCCEKSCNKCPSKKKKTSGIKPGNFIKTNKLCDYGCGKTAKYQFNNGNVCCENFSQRCPSIKKRNSESSLGMFSGEKHPMFGKHWSEETRIKMSESQKKRYGDPKERKKASEYHKNMSKETRQKLSKAVSNRRNTHPELLERQREYMLNGGAVYANSFIKNPSKPQVKVFKKVKKIFPEAKLNYPVYETNKSIDIALPDKMIAIEYDGSYWHQDKEYDKKRQRELESFGWRFIRYKDYIPSKEELLKDIQKIDKVD